MSDTPPVTDALAALASTPTVLRALLGEVAPDRIEAPADEDWSPRDVVAHLVTTERPFSMRFRRIVEEDEPALPDIDENDLLAREGARPLAALLDELAERRSEDVAWLRAQDEAAWSRGGMHEIAGRVTLSELICHKAFHDQLHLAQLARMLGGPFDEARGPMRVFF